MNGMFAQSFTASWNDDFANTFSFHHELAPAGALCELSLTSANELDDQAGTSLGFTSYTYADPDGTPHDVAIDYGARRPEVGHDRMIRVEWYMRIYHADSVGLFTAFFWDHVW